MRFNGSYASLDAIDRQILKAILLDARVQNQDLAARVGLSPSGCLHRVRRLEQSGVIKRYVTDIDETELGGWLTLWGEIVLTAEGRAARSELETSFAKAPELVEARRLVGRTDYLMRVVGRDPSVWPTLLERLDPDGVFISAATVQIESGVAKRFSGLPQLEK